MRKLTGIIKRFVRDEEGATMVEYALMVALIAVVVIGAVTFLGEEVEKKFEAVSDSITKAGADTTTQQP